MIAMNEFNVLIVEDNIDVSEVLSTDLKEINFASNISIAHTLKEAMRYIEEVKGINFILIDWNLPDGTGIALLEKLRKSAPFQDCPIMMVTAQDNIDDVLEAMRLGANEYLIKPWTPAELKEKIDHMIEKNQPTTLGI